MMRWIGVAVLCMGLGGGAALAEENFIPKGHVYSPDNEQLPPLNSREDQINKQTDIYETEIYTVQKQRKLFESEMNRFIYSQEPGGADYLPDY
jgi:hypothetical protein